MSDCSDDEAATDKQLKVVIVGDGASGKVRIPGSTVYLTTVYLTTWIILLLQ